MRQASKRVPDSAEKTIRDIRRATRRHHSAEEKIRIVLEGLRGEDSIAELCRKEGINQNLYYRWSKEFLEAGKKRLAGDTAREATSDEVEAAGRAVKEYIDVFDDEAFGAATDVAPKFVSPDDPAARWTGAHGGQAFFAYSTNYLVDVDNAIIVDVEATTAIRQAEVLAAKRMIERSLDRFDLYPARLLGDSAYGDPQNLWNHCSATFSSLFRQHRSSTSFRG